MVKLDPKCHQLAQITKHFTIENSIWLYFQWTIIQHLALSSIYRWIYFLSHLVFFLFKTSTTFYICILILFLFSFLYKYKRCVKSRKFVMINEQVMAFSCFIEICTRNSHTQRETESERYKTCPYKISSNENSGSVKLTEISTFFSINRSLTQM